MVLVGKDMRGIWNRNGVRALLTAAPLLLIVVLPLAYAAAIGLAPLPATAVPPEKLRAFLSSSAEDYRSFWMEAFSTLLCPLLYLCVPIISSVAAASCAFVSEKENRTLETLFLSSVSARSIFNAKITACVLISLLISWISFLLCTLAQSVADILLSARFFFNLEWLVLVFPLTPALVLFSVVFVSLILIRVQSVGECLQTMGYLVLPLVALYIAQFAGALHVSFWLLLFLSVVLLAAAMVLFNLSSRRFQAEKL